MLFVKTILGSTTPKNDSKIYTIISIGNHFKVLKLFCSVFQMYSLQDVIQMTHKFFNVTQEYKDPVITFTIIYFIKGNVLVCRAFLITQ